MSQSSDFNGIAKVTVKLDGKETHFDLNTAGDTILNAALDKGLDAPYSCKGGICTTCQAKILKGTVRMDQNHALTPRELEKGYVLVCQSHPTSEEVILTWDI